jgi:hypothetical protein
MTKFHLKNEIGKSIEYFCQFCPKIFNNRKTRQSHMHRRHESELLTAVEVSYAGITAALSPLAALLPAVLPNNDNAVDSSLGFAETDPASTSGIAADIVYHTAPPLSENLMSTSEIQLFTQDQLLTSPASDPDQLIELSWEHESSDQPSIHYLPKLANHWITPVHDQNLGLATSVSAPPVDLSSITDNPINMENTDIWRPTITPMDNQPEWVSYRNTVLQKLLDSASPLFVYGADIGTPMCQTVMDQFDKLQIDVDNTWSRQEIEVKRKRRLGNSITQV